MPIAGSSRLPVPPGSRSGSRPRAAGAGEPREPIPGTGWCREFPGHECEPRILRRWLMTLLPAVPLATT